MEFLWEIGVFGAKALIIVLSVAGVLIVAVGLNLKNHSLGSAELHFEKLNDKFKEWRDHINEVLLTDKDLKKLRKAEKQAQKKHNKKSPHCFVLDFDGDIKASRVDMFRNEVSALLQVAKASDEVLIRLESPGGLVSNYGLAAAQLVRIRNHGLKLTVAVDRVAASGGYLMACVAQHIIATPFAVVGSIGVLAQVPNFHKWLKKNDVEYKEITAGEYKRTLTSFGEITDKGIAKFTEQIEGIHQLFKAFVEQYRPELDIAQVATGEYWFGTQALQLGLINELKTSDEWIESKCATHEVYHLRMESKKNWNQKLSGWLQSRLSHWLPFKIEPQHLIGGADPTAMQSHTVVSPSIKNFAIKNFVD